MELNIHALESKLILHEIKLYVTIRVLYAQFAVKWRFTLFVCLIYDMGTPNYLYKYAHIIFENRAHASFIGGTHIFLNTENASREKSWTRLGHTSYENRTHFFKKRHTLH